jgi:hypothetical protein
VSTQQHDVLEFDEELSTPWQRAGAMESDSAATRTATPATPATCIVRVEVNQVFAVGAFQQLLNSGALDSQKPGAIVAGERPLTEGVQ